jgi:hypothetical protein
VRIKFGFQVGLHSNIEFILCGQDSSLMIIRDFQMKEKQWIQNSKKKELDFVDSGQLANFKITDKEKF